jgi:hypothetical protein
MKLFLKHERKYLKQGCDVARHFSTEVTSKNKMLPNRLVYHIGEKNVSVHVGSGRNDPKEVDWIFPPTRVRKARGALSAYWDLQ